MAECDEEAKLKPDTMHFLIVPVASTGLTLPGFSASPISNIGNSAALLSSTDTLIGLRNRVLVLYQKPMTFAVSDPTTKTVYKWKPAVGVTALKTRETGSSSLTLGFEIPDVAKEIEWGPTINLNKGTCYWINPLVRGPACAADDGAARTRRGGQRRVVRFRRVGKIAHAPCPRDRRYGRRFLPTLRSLVRGGVRSG